MLSEHSILYSPSMLGHVNFYFQFPAEIKANVSLILFKKNLKEWILEFTRTWIHQYVAV